MQRCVWCVIGLGMVLNGCSEQSAPRSETPIAAKQQGRLMPQPPPPPVPQGQGAPPSAAQGGAVPSGTPNGPSPNAPQPASPDATRVKAEVGVGKRGQLLNDKGAINKMIVTPALVLFRTEQRVVFEIQVPHALQLYEATNGRKPATHEEFMEQIIKANQIELPELPAGQRYIYDPQTGELMVEKPAG